jgi:hypothetical protein
MSSLTDKLKKLGSLGEKELVGGLVLVFPDNIPMVGDLVVVRDADGNETTPPDGQHETVDGWLISTKDGEIVAVTEPTAETEVPDVEASESSQELSEGGSTIDTTRIEELENKIVELSNKLDMKPAKNPVSTKDNGADSRQDVRVGNERRFSSDHLLEMLDFYKGVKQNRAKFNQLRNEFNYKQRQEGQFGSGWDLTNVVPRCADYINDIAYVRILNDGLLNIFKNITSQATGSDINKYNTRIPIMDFAPDADLWVQDEQCGFTPLGDKVPNNRMVEVHPLCWEHEQCEIDAKGVFNGGIYMGEDAIPAEVVVMDLIMDRLARDLEKVALYGRGNILGLFNEIQDAIQSGCIPASQWVSQAAYTNANAIDLVEELIDLVPEHMSGLMSDLMFMTHYKVPSYYYKNYRTAFGTPPQFGYPQAPQEAINEMIPDTPFPVQWFKSYSFGSNPVGLNLSVLTNPDNIAYVLEEPTFNDGMKIWYNIDEQKIRFRWCTSFGINFGLCDNIVTNITDVIALP